MRFRVMTQNVRSFPVMSQDKVAEDVKLTGRQCGIVGWQEIYPERYEEAISSLNKFDHYLAEGAPISWRKKWWKFVSSGKEVLHEAEEKILKKRLLVWVVLEHTVTGVRIAVTNKHYVAHAWSGGDHRELRQSMWRHANQMDRRITKEFIEMGYPVIALGDYNSQNRRFKPLGETLGGVNVQYVVPQRSIDQIILVDSRDHKWIAGEPELMTGRNSDHQGRRAKVRLEKRNA